MVKACPRWLGVGPRSKWYASVGAWRLADLAGQAVGGSNVQGPTVVAARKIRLRWVPFVEDPTDEKAPKKDPQEVWRVAETIGMDAAAPPDLRYTDKISDPAVIRIEDSGLHFRDQPKLWPDPLKRTKGSASVVLHTCAPLVSGALWKHLIKHHRDRLTVVTSLGALRQLGASIGSPLSWDKTVHEIAAFLLGKGRSLELLLAKRLVIGIGADGAASFTRLEAHGKGTLSDRAKFERCLYDPTFLEDAWCSARPGQSVDGTAILAAAVTRHEWDSATYPLFVALGRGLAAMRTSHQRGGGFVESVRSTVQHLADAFEHPKKDEPAASFYTAYPHTVTRRFFSWATSNRIQLTARLHRRRAGSSALHRHRRRAPGPESRA